MKYESTVIAVKDINEAKKFYQDLFGLEIFQDYGINVSFTCGISLQQEFDWLVDISKDKIISKPNNMELCFEEKHFDDFLRKLKNYSNIEVLGIKEHTWGQRVVRFYDLDGHLIEVGEQLKTIIQRFLTMGMSMDEVSKKMDVSVSDLNTLLNEG